MKAVLINAALIGTGGFLGAIFRFSLSGFVQRSAGVAAFPYGTLVVNLIGCLLIGLAVGLMDARQLVHPEVRSFVLVGLLGGFTTYSTFGLETFALLRDADYLRAFASVALHLVAGLLLVWIGYALASR
ncbi:MAG: fluoride efflux transporter CrcB [Woeseiaceae bacterium]